MSIFGAEHPMLTAVRVARAVAAWSTPGAQLAAADEHLARYAVALGCGDMEGALAFLRQAAEHVPHLSPVAATLALSLRMTEGGA